MDSPSDLLVSRRLRSLIAELRRRYGWVILDLPPSLAVSDIQTVGPLADTAVFVVQWGKTSRSTAASGLNVLEKAGIKIVGVALTQVDLARQSLYSNDEAGEFYRKYREYFKG